MARAAKTGGVGTILARSAHVDPFERDRTRLLVTDDHIHWLAGQRLLQRSKP